MKQLALALLFLCLLLDITEVCAQKNYGILSDDTTLHQSIDLTEYHQYELELTKGAINILRITDYEVAMEFTVVSPKGVVIERINNADTGDFLIFESLADGTYQFYIHIIDDESGQAT